MTGDMNTQGHKYKFCFFLLNIVVSAVAVSITVVELISL